MDYLPAPVLKFLEGSIDPNSQKLVEDYSQYALIAITLLAFMASFASKSVLIGLEVFAAGLVAILLAFVPAWPCLNKHQIRYLSVRRAKME